MGYVYGLKCENRYSHVCIWLEFLGFFFFFFVYQGVL